MFVGFAESQKNTYCLFTDEGIYCYNDYKNRLFPYGNIKKISFSLDCLTIIGKENGEQRSFLIWMYDPVDQQTIKQMLPIIKKIIKASPYKDMQQVPKITEAEKKKIRERSTRVLPTEMELTIDAGYEDKRQKKNLTILCTALAVLLVIVFLLIKMIAGTSFYKKDKDREFDDVFNKDPNNWSEEEKEYVNDLFDWIDENNR